MIRGTTPTHTFALPISLSEFKNIRIVYAQDSTVILKKELQSCHIVDNTITVTLTQEETLKFSHKKPVRIQIKALTVNGEVVSTPIHVVSVEECLDDEVIV